MSSIDRPTSGDGDPDQFALREARPFPGASSDREPASAPGPAPSMEQMRAAYANAGSARDIEASAKADEDAAARGSGTGTRDPGVSESSAEGARAGGDRQGTVRGAQPGVQDGAVVPGTVVPDGDGEGPSVQADASVLASEARPPEIARAERTDIPAFPGASVDREPATSRGPAPSMDQMREAFARSSNSDELQAAAKADEAAAKEAAAGKGTVAAKPGNDAATARDVSARDPDQPTAMRPQQEMPAAEASHGDPAPPLDGNRPDTSLQNQSDARHEDAVVLDQIEDAEAEPVLEGIESAKDSVVTTRSDAAVPEADDKPVAQGVVEPQRPEAGLSPEERETGDTNASRSEVRLDNQSDDQRPVTRAEMMAMLSELEARHRAELDAVKAEQKAEHEAEIGSLKADYDAKFDELKAKVVSDAEQRGDRPQRSDMAPEHVPDDPAIGQAQEAALEQRDNSRRGSDERNAEPSRWRQLVTSERVSAVGTVANAVNAATLFGMHASPEGMASLGMAVLSLGGLGLAKIEKRRKDKKEKDGRPD